MRPFRLLPTITRSPFGGFYLRAGRKRRLLHFPPFGARGFNLLTWRV